MNISVSLDLVDPNPWQTRIGEPDAEYLKVLSEDIKRNGLLQFPVGRLVREDGREVVVGVTEWEDLLQSGEVRVQLAFGHNRVAALRLLDWGAVNIEVRRLSDEQMADFAWSENEKRRAHSPLERAMAMQQRVTDFGWTQAQVATHLGVSRPVVSNALRLLKLPEDVREALHSGVISERVAMALVSLFELPVSLRDKSFLSQQTIQKALRGEATSEEIRLVVKNVIEAFATNLEQAYFSLDDEISHVAMRSLSCRECEQRLKDRNICLDGLCYRGKKAMWEMDYLARASKASGIMVSDERSNFTVFYDYMSDRQRALEFARGEGCENLRIRFLDGAANSVPGFECAQIVCQARGGECLCLSAVQDAARTMQADKDAVVRELVSSRASVPEYDHENVEAAREVFVQQLVDGLARKDAGAWRFLNAACVLHGAREPGNEDIARAFMYNLARWLVERKCPDFQGVEGVRAIMREVLG